MYIESNHSEQYDKSQNCVIHTVTMKVGSIGVDETEIYCIKPHSQSPSRKYITGMYILFLCGCTYIVHVHCTNKSVCLCTLKISLS